MAPKKLSDEQWNDVRNVWEGDEREGFTWVVAQLNLPVSREAVRKKAAAQKWMKHNNNNDVHSTASRKAHTGEFGRLAKAAHAIESAVTSATIQTASQAQPKPTPQPRKPPSKTAEKQPEPAYPGLVDAATNEGCGASDWEDSNQAASSGERQNGNSRYMIEFNALAKKFALLGANDKQIAEHLGITVRCLAKWRDKYPAFRKAILDGKEVADAEVAEALYNRARGYSHDAVKIFNNNGQILEAPYIEHYPPDVNAAKLWLTNRQPQAWREKVEVQNEVSVRVIPWDDLQTITRQALAQAEQRHREIIEGRAVRLGIRSEYIARDIIEEAGDDGEAD